MRKNMFVVATLGAVMLPGCVLEARRSREVVAVESHATFAAEVSVNTELTYTYFPAQHAYFCESRDEWWVIEGGGWIRTRTRPTWTAITATNISVTCSTAQKRSAGSRIAAPKFCSAAAVNGLSAR